MRKRETTSNGERERYTQLNAEFQKRAKRDKKGFLSESCKEIEENSIMGQTRDLLKNIGDTKRTLHAKTGTIKDRNGMDLREAKGIKKMWQDTQNNYAKMIFMTHITTMM